MRVSPSAALAVCLFLGTAAGRRGGSRPSHCHEGCHVLPGDAAWPSEKTWHHFNKTVDGRLVATKPFGSPCHDPTFDEAACKALQQKWPLPQLHLESSFSMMHPYFANESCDPFTPREKPCTLGNYVSYAVDVSTPDHVKAALHFAQRNNIRVLVRNTGHDFLGRSTGAGALGIWTHHNNDVKVVDWSDETYTGPAVKVPAGGNGAQIAELTNKHGLVVVGGECPTVGLAGGYIQGGGHSVLSTYFGLAADQALEYEVITADRRLVKASPHENKDLYWALSGGGAGTYGVVWSVTVRAHPAGQVGGGKIEFGVNGNTTQGTFNKAVSKFHAMLPAMIDKHATVNYMLQAKGLSIGTVTALNQTGDYVRDEVMGPFLKELKEMGIQASTSYTTLSYRDHYDRYMGPLPYGSLPAEGNQFGSRLLPRSLVEKNNDALQVALQNLTSAGLVGLAVAGRHEAPKNGVPNAVLPAWRDTMIHMQIVSYWDPTKWGKMMQDQKSMTNDWVPQLASLTPEMGAYMNEADFNEPNWKETFFGVNYDKLLAIKKKWDPRGVFYALKTVGSDQWNVAHDGRMCRA